MQVTSSLNHQIANLVNKNKKLFHYQITRAKGLTVQQMDWYNDGWYAKPRQDKLIIMKSGSIQASGYSR